MGDDLRRSKSAVFRMYSALTSHGYSKSIKAVRRQRNLGLTNIMINAAKKSFRFKSFKKKKKKKKHEWFDGNCFFYEKRT
jgi:hypothetical protein